MKKRLEALATKSAQDRLILTEEQLAALEKAKERKVAHGEIETEHPGYLGSQGHLLCWKYEGCGQNLSADFYRHLHNQVKLYTDKSAITAADMLNDKVLPFYEEQGIANENLN